jgi:site-specific recombinase XerD
MTIRISNKDDFKTKSKKERTIALNETAYNVLARMKRKDEYFFSRLDGLKRDKHFICRSFKKALVKAGLGDGYCFHSLRHTFASQLVQKGISLYMVQKLMGHANIRTTKIYAYLAPEKFHGVVGVLELGSDRSQNREKVVISIKSDS